MAEGGKKPDALFQAVEQMVAEGDKMREEAEGVGLSDTLVHIVTLAFTKGQAFGSRGKSSFVRALNALQECDGLMGFGVDECGAKTPEDREALNKLVPLCVRIALEGGHEHGHAVKEVQ